MFYYKIYNLQGKFLGIATSLDLRYYHPKGKRILCCKEKLAQYICLNDIFYRVQTFNTESPNMVGKFPEAFAERTTKEEYQKYRAKVKAEIPD